MVGSSNRRGGGGAATAVGMAFQHRVAAWVAVRILAEQDASLPWHLPVGTTLEFLRCETEQPVDDLLVGTSGDGFVFTQIKHSVQLSRQPDSDLAVALQQFARQFVACRTGSSVGRPWERPLEDTRDRLVLTTSPKSSKTIRNHLTAVLNRLRKLSQRQSIGEAASNKEEQNALSVLTGHIERSWGEILGARPLEQEIRQLLSLIHIEVLDVDENGDAEREAKSCLRTTILRDPSQADAAWSKLIAFCESLAAERSGAGRTQIQQVLLHAGIELRAARSYRDDIEQMKRHSETVARLVADLSRIRVGPTQVKIQRPCVDSLRHVVEEGSILVVGKPGAGKSGALYDLVQRLQNEGQDVVFLAVDHLAARSLGELREELELTRDLTEVFQNWPGTRPAYLVIDALDAARADYAARTVQDLIRVVSESNGRWRVVASIRKFDLRYSHELRLLFAGEPPTEFRDDEFVGIRHLNVRELSNDELSQIAPQSPLLQELIDSAPEELHDLLRVPFNLRLMGELLSAGVALADLTPIRTQLELLDRYWAKRIIGSDRLGDAREAILSRVCEEMVRGRALRVDRMHISEPATSLQLTELLSCHVLSEWQRPGSSSLDRYVLTFSHHVLFDYAVARLLLRGAPEALVGRLATDPELVLMVRPSVLLRFRHLWMLDRSHEQFWDLVFRIISTEALPEIGKLIGPSVAGDMGKQLLDLEILCTALESSDERTRTAAEQALRHLVGSLLAAPSDRLPLAGSGAGPWSDLLERVSRSLRTPLAYSVRPLLSNLCQHPDILTSEQRASTGKAARRLLGFAWEQLPRDQWLVIHALEAVCRTFESDPAAAAAILRRCLGREHLTEHGFQELPWLAREVKRLMCFDPQLVEEIYQAAFSHQERSDEPTPMGGRLLPMVSNRRQDFGMALHELAEVFPEFLNHNPKTAVRSLIAVIESYIMQRHSHGTQEIHEESFEFDGQEARIRTDYSSIWDESDTHRIDEPLKMLDAFDRYFERLAENDDRLEELGELIKIIVRENRSAVLWRHLLLLGTRFPATIGRAILPLGWAVPVLTTYDTTAPVGEFLRAIFPGLDHSERGFIERAIRSIPDTFPAERREGGEHIRNRLLGCLSDSDLVTEETRQLLADLRAADAVPPNEPPVRFSGVTSSPYGEEEYLRDEGVPVEAEANRRIRDLERPVDEFAHKYLNSVPSQEDVDAVSPAMERLWLALAQADKDGVHQKQQDHAWDCLAAACGPIAKMDGLSCDEGVGAFLREVLLKASQHPEPEPDPKYDAQFDEHPSWGRPAPRIEGAQAMILLARHPSCASPEVLEEIARLISDPVPAVRYQVISCLNALYRTAPDLMWRSVERLSKQEESRGVLRGLLSGTLGRLAGADPDRAVTLTKNIYDRVNDGPGSSEVRGLCIDMFTSLYIWRNETACGQIVLTIIQDPAAKRDDVLHVVGHLRQPLTYGPVHPVDPTKDAVRNRAVEMLTRLLCSTRDGLRAIEASHEGKEFNNWPEEHQGIAKSLARLIDAIGNEIYFASGAYDAKRQGGHSGQRLVTDEERQRFYREVGPILDGLSESGLPSVAHHLLEALEVFIPLDPRGVFLRIGRVINNGQKAGYQYESLAADLMVRLIERYLAEYRSVLREDAECRQTLLDVLDVFVKAGWPSARRLTYRLEEIFR